MRVLLPRLKNSVVGGTNISNNDNNQNNQFEHEQLGFSTSTDQPEQQKQLYHSDDQHPPVILLRSCSEEEEQKQSPVQSLVNTTSYSSGTSPKHIDCEFNGDEDKGLIVNLSSLSNLAVRSSLILGKNSLQPESQSTLPASPSLSTPYQHQRNRKKRTIATAVADSSFPAQNQSPEKVELEREISNQSDNTPAKLSALRGVAPSLESTASTRLDCSPQDVAKSSSLQLVTQESVIETLTGNLGKQKKSNDSNLNPEVKLVPSQIQQRNRRNKRYSSPPPSTLSRKRLAALDLYPSNLSCGATVHQSSSSTIVATSTALRTSCNSVSSLDPTLAGVDKSLAVVQVPKASVINAKPSSFTSDRLQSQALHRETLSPLSSPHSVAPSVGSISGASNKNHNSTSPPLDSGVFRDCNSRNGNNRSKRLRQSDAKPAAKASASALLNDRNTNTNYNAYSSGYTGQVVAHKNSNSNNNSNSYSNMTGGGRRSSRFDNNCDDDSSTDTDNNLTTTTSTGEPWINNSHNSRQATGQKRALRHNVHSNNGSCNNNSNTNKDAPVRLFLTPAENEPPPVFQVSNNNNHQHQFTIATATAARSHRHTNDDDVEAASSPKEIVTSVAKRKSDNPELGDNVPPQRSANDYDLTDSSSHCNTSARGRDGGIVDDESLITFQKLLKKIGLEMVEQDGDGNCLFRAVSLQVYGHPDQHTEVRERCMDYMASNEEHYCHFVTTSAPEAEFGGGVGGESFLQYIARKRQPGVHGNHAEIQAISELYNRPVEVYRSDGLCDPHHYHKGHDHQHGVCSSTGHKDDEKTNLLQPMNIFHAEYKTSDVPIRLSYHDGNHYNAIIDPLVPTAGLGLGLPGLQPGLADKMQVAAAVTESDQLADQMELERILKESAKEHELQRASVVEDEQDDLQRALKESAHTIDYMYEKKVMALSDLEATNFELEQEVLADSWDSYSRQEHDGGRKQRASPAVSSSTSGRRRQRSTTTMSPSTMASLPFSSESCSSVAAVATAAAVPSSQAYAASAAVASVTTASQTAASASFQQGGDTSTIPQASFSTYYDIDQNHHVEYPQTVQELVMNGFELNKVLRAHELVGDNFDDLLAFLLSSTTTSK